MSDIPSRQWLDRARQDLAAARLMRDNGFTGHCCFLAQQTIEKTLKSYLIAKTGNYPFSHALTDLVKQCAAFDTGILHFMAECAVVDQYYISTRYPSGIPSSIPEGMPGATEAEEALATADEVLTYVSNAVQTLFPPDVGV